MRVKLCYDTHRPPDNVVSIVEISFVRIDRCEELSVWRFRFRLCVL